MTTAHEQYYTQPDHGRGFHFTDEVLDGVIARVVYRVRLDEEPAAHDKFLFDMFADGHRCEHCKCPVSLTLSGDADEHGVFTPFHIMDEDGEHLLCEDCHETRFAEPSEDQPACEFCRANDGEEHNGGCPNE